jgi:type IV pilus assembly protein PilM
MKPAPGVWGIDLGQCALKAVRLQEVDGQLTATAFDYVEYPKILSQPDADPDQLTREALEQFLSRNTLRGDNVAIAVPGQSGLARFVKLPPVEEKKIADIVKFEAKQQIPFNLDEVVWDYQKLGASNVVDGFALETEIGLFAMKRDMVNRYLQHFKDVGVEVHLIQMAPLALCNFVAYDLLGKDLDGGGEEGKKNCVVALDIGADSSNLVITDGNKVIWQRPIPLGGNHFTRALTKDMKLTFAKAEHLKRNATKSGAAELKKILASLKPVLNDFVGEVQRSLGYFTNTHRDAQIEYMMGLGNAFRLPGLQRFLSEKLQLEVRKLEKMSRLGGDTVLSAPIYNDNILSFAVAYGLALQGVQKAKLITNLLPGEIRLERLVRAKKPWAVAAAGLLLLALGAAALGNFLDERPYTGPVIEAIGKAKTANDKARQMDTLFNTARDNALKEELAVKAIVAGQSEQLNWMHLIQFVSQCVPQADGTGLPPEERDKFWVKRPTNRKGAMSGQDAYKEYSQRLREGFKPHSEDVKETDPLPPGIDDLVQFTIESVDCRFCDDLPTFWKEARKGSDRGLVRPLEDFDKPPDRKEGWVVEIAGYTYHGAMSDFVTSTLLTNIPRLGKKEAPKPPPEAAPPPAGKPGAAPPPGPAAPPAAPPAGPPGAGGAPGTTDEFEATKEPVINRVSHAILYAYVTKPATEGAAFEKINKGVLDDLLKNSGGGGKAGSGSGMAGGAPAGSPAGMGGGAGGSSGPSAPDRSSWSPLGSRTGGGGGGGAGGRPGGAAGGGMGPPGLPGMGGPGGSGGQSNRPARPAPGATQHQRTEFVILFIWKEPTPSDTLRNAASGATPAPQSGSPPRPPGK